jgi:hypothetical protein
VSCGSATDDSLLLYQGASELKPKGTMPNQNDKPPMEDLESTKKEVKKSAQTQLDSPVLPSLEALLQYIEQEKK